MTQGTVNTNTLWFKGRLAARNAALETRDIAVEEAKRAVQEGASDTADKLEEAIRLASAATHACRCFAEDVFENQKLNGPCPTAVKLFAIAREADNVVFEMVRLQETLGEAVNE